MKARTASRLAWSLWVVAIVLLIVNVVFSVRADALGDIGVFVFVYPIFLLAFATVGALIAARQPGNAIGWVFIGTGLAWAILGAADAYAAYALATGQEASLAARAADWVNIWFYGRGSSCRSRSCSCCSRTGGCRRRAGGRSCGSRSWGTSGSSSGTGSTQ